MNDQRTQRTRAILTRAAIIACIVGPILTLINQWEAVTGGASFDLLKFGLTLLVPFTVSSVSSVLSSRDHRRQMTALDREYEQKIAALEEQNAARSVQMEPDVPPRGDNPSDRIDETEGLLKEVRQNAKNVNTASVERVAFMDALIVDSQTSAEKLKDLWQWAQQAEAAVKSANSDVQDLLGTNDIVSQDAKLSQTRISEISASVATFSDRLADVRDATEKIHAMAMQTRLLSLNASVEAARAGELGKGFNVVASEVKSLSERSTASLDQIEASVEKLNASFEDIRGVVTKLEGNFSQTHQSLTRTCEQAGQLDEVTGTLVGTLVEMNSHFAEELPKFESLIENLKNIKGNTEAAVKGSAKNIRLCDAALSILTVDPHAVPAEPTARAGQA